MNSTVLSNKEALRYGWGVMKSNLPLFIGLCLISMFVSGMQNALGDPSRGLYIGSRVLLGLAIQLFMLIVHMGWLYIALRLHDGRSVEFRDLLTPLPQFLEFLLTMLLYGAIVTVGFILLIVPGVIWALRFGFAGMLVIDQKLDPLGALRRSAELTAGVKSELFVFGLLLAGLNFLGAMAFGIGLFATLPTSIMAAVYVYRKLLARVEAKRAAQPASAEHLAPA
jgi:uncharacterized membrane protein